MQRRHALISICGLISLPLLSGCANVTPSRSKLGSLPTLPTLPAARLADQTVVLEIAFADVPNDPTWAEDVWSELDEQHLPPSIRQRISTNGFRAGVVGIQLPDRLREQLDLQQRIGMRGILTEMAPGDQSATGARRIQLRSGNRSDVVTRSSQPSLVVLIDDGEQVIGKTFRDAQTAFSMRAFPMPDGRVRLELTPEVRFGPTKQRWSTGEGNMFQMEAGQDRKSYPRMKIEAVLNPGQTLVVATSGASRSLGGNFFAKGVDGQPEKALLIRLAQSNYEDMADLGDPGFDPMEELNLGQSLVTESFDQAPNGEAYEVIDDDDNEEFETGLTTQLD